MRKPHTQVIGLSKGKRGLMVRKPGMPEGTSKYLLPKQMNRHQKQRYQKLLEDDAWLDQVWREVDIYTELQRIHRKGGTISSN